MTKKPQEAVITFYTKDSEKINLHCEIAKNLFQKMKGLMHRKSLPENRGMLFTFLIPWHRFFWMKNVKIPLDIIFVNRNFEIISIHEAPVEPGILYKNYWSHGFCKYVVEINMGFCKKNGIKKADKIKIVN